MKYLISAAAAASALLLTACGDDSSSSASNEDKTAYSVSKSGSYTIDKEEQLLIITPDDAVEACVWDDSIFSWKSLSPDENIDTIQFELSGDTLVLYPAIDHKVGDTYVGDNKGKIEGSWTYTGCYYDRTEEETTCGNTYKTISLSISKGKFKKEAEYLFDKYLEDVEAGYTNSQYMSALYATLADKADQPASAEKTHLRSPDITWILESNKGTAKDNKKLIKDLDIKIIETSKTSQTFSIGEKTYTFKVNKGQLVFEKNGLLSADLSVEVSSGSTTCTNSYTQKLASKDLCGTKPEKKDGVRTGMSKDTDRSHWSDIYDFYVVSNNAQFIECLESIAAN